ncbi:MAG: hypothetical protein LBV27_10045 [Oscillospiraceae bacterium]|jgi:D-alanyl-D-alanine carboxypeptidase|nr:hypothetical protein [Oscillospiraceae bacterium]
MKKISLVLSFAFIAVHLFFMPATGYALDTKNIYSDAAVLMDADTGQVLYDKNMHTRIYPASTTKIMTGILAVEQCFPGEILTVSSAAVNIDEPMSSNINLTPGEELTMDSAMYALMLPSANDAANVIAEHVAGSQAQFAKMMTEKARLIGAVNTNFANAHGLHDPAHYTTAYDMALITRYAGGSSAFMRYFGADLYTMPATNTYSAERSFSNYQYMLIKTSQFFNEDVIGGKVGYTTPAKHTMSTLATRDGRTLICVTMGSNNRNEKFYDTQKLLDFGFEEFTRVTVPKNDFGGLRVPVRQAGEPVGDVLFRPSADFTFLLHNSADIADVRFSYETPDYYDRDGVIQATVSLVAESGEERVPTVLMTSTLAPEMHVRALPASVAAGDVPKPVAVNLASILIFGICATTLIVMIGAMRYHRVQKRRRARLARMNRRLYGPSYESRTRQAARTAR